MPAASCNDRLLLGTAIEFEYFMAIQRDICSNYRFAISKLANNNCKQHNKRTIFTINRFSAEPFDGKKTCLQFELASKIANIQS